MLNAEVAAARAKRIEREQHTLTLHKHAFSGVHAEAEAHVQDDEIVLQRGVWSLMAETPGVCSHGEDVVHLAKALRKSIMGDADERASPLSKGTWRMGNSLRSSFGVSWPRRARSCSRAAFVHLQAREPVACRRASLGLHAHTHTPASSQ